MMIITMIPRRRKKNEQKEKIYTVLFYVEGQYRYYLLSCFECLNETSRAMVNT